MKKSNTMLQAESTVAIPSKNGKNKKFFKIIKIIICVTTPLLCALSVLLFMLADVALDYSDLEGGISVEEYNGYIIFKAKVPEGRSGIAFSYDFPNSDVETHRYYLNERICIYTERYNWWFGEKQEQIIYVISNDGRNRYFTSLEIEKTLAAEYKYEESNSQEWQAILNELSYCRIKNKKAVGEEKLLWKLNPDE